MINYARARPAYESCAREDTLTSGGGGGVECSSHGSGQRESRELEGKKIRRTHTWVPLAARVIYRDDVSYTRVVSRRIRHA